MEKISIVQRRRRNKEVQTAALLRAKRREQMKKDVHQYLDSMPQNEDKAAADASPERSEHSDLFDVTLSPEQTNELNSLFNYCEIMKGSTEEANVRIYRNEKNEVVFRFMFEPKKSLQMLTSEDVCNLLKISRRTLYKNVHNNEITSYKIGSQLRFLAEDIVEYFRKSKQN
ncbi:helix-turn-helix domain-containing protein [candidate division KSB1 bacterium]|nr:helix-turn-helix domain-containing protein [candidate division KSB1 bacterium]